MHKCAFETQYWWLIYSKFKTNYLNNTKTSKRNIKGITNLNMDKYNFHEYFKSIIIWFRKLIIDGVYVVTFSSKII